MKLDFTQKTLRRLWWVLSPSNTECHKSTQRVVKQQEKNVRNSPYQNELYTSKESWAWWHTGRLSMVAYQEAEMEALQFNPAFEALT